MHEVVGSKKNRQQYEDAVPATLWKSYVPPRCRTSPIHFGWFVVSRDYQLSSAPMTFSNEKGLSRGSFLCIPALRCENLIFFKM